MKEINIAKTLISKRREKGITQDELAEYIGVSKASVSKWETGQSYPDITFLPQLAAYFNISIDELMNYSPQMTKEDIIKLYRRLSAAFASQPFEKVLAECRDIIRKYYSCFPLLLQMVVLLINHYMLAADRNTQTSILEEAVALCKRIKAESEDVWLSKDATSLEAVCRLFLQQPDEILDLFGETLRRISSDEVIVAQAYQMKGNIPKAKEVLQIGMYQHLLQLVGFAQQYMTLYIGDKAMFEEILSRVLAIAAAFKLNKLHPNSMGQLYYAAAHGYTVQGDIDKALDMLKNYADLCSTGFFPFLLHGDNFFNSIDDWFSELDLGTAAPRDEKVIKESMLQAVLANPVFDALKDQPRYKSTVEILKANLGG